jgi:DNA-binding NtrC family response regulator
MRRRSAVSVRCVDRSCTRVKILLFEDDQAFRTALAENLREDGHEVAAYAGPACAPPASSLTDARVVITDQAMAPGDLSGLEFADAFHAVHPAVPVVLVTACATAELDAEVSARPFVHLRRKPIAYDELHALVHHLAG